MSIATCKTAAKEKEKKKIPPSSDIMNFIACRERELILIIIQDLFMQEKKEKRNLAA